MTLIILIAWLYVVLMLAVTQDSVFSMISIFLCFGVLPLWFFAWRARNKLRRQRRQAEESGGEA